MHTRITTTLTLAVLGTAYGCERPAPVVATPQRVVLPAEVVPPPDTPSPYPELDIVASNYPKVDGSTSAEPLQVMLACKVLGTNYTWMRTDSDRDVTREKVMGRYEESDFQPERESHRLIASDDLDRLSLAADYQGEKRALCKFINSATTHHGTHNAYVNLISREVDMILVARIPSPSELQLASQRNVELEVVPVALDAFVFLLHDENPIDTLALEQIRDIYSGRITNWREVGGVKQDITAYQRNPNSGSQEVMLTTVMRDRKIMKATEMLIGNLMGSPFLSVTSDRFGIGYSFYFYQEFMAFRRLKVCKVNGVAPTPETISTFQYPLVTEVYALLRQDTSATHPVRRLRDWLLEPDGQAMVQECGYVSIDRAVAQKNDQAPRQRFGPETPILPESLRLRPWHRPGRSPE